MCPDHNKVRRILTAIYAERRRKGEDFLRHFEETVLASREFVDAELQLIESVTNAEQNGQNRDSFQ